MRSTLASSASSVPGFARGARAAPRQALFVADFLAPSIELIVEVDGAIHARKQSADARRDRKLQRERFRIVRIGAENSRPQSHSSGLRSNSKRHAQVLATRGTLYPRRRV
jgi:very-short-patch-repair endonuclease